MAQPPVMLYALSTCGHCKSAKQFLEDNGVEYDYVYVDLLDKDERNKVLEDTKEINPRRAFPAIVVGEKVIIGFREDELREALAL